MLLLLLLLLQLRQPSLEVILLCCRNCCLGGRDADVVDREAAVEEGSAAYGVRFHYNVPVLYGVRVSGTCALPRAGTLQLVLASCWPQV